jgi:thiosulfate sulfurtransferase
MSEFKRIPPNRPKPCANKAQWWSTSATRNLAACHIAGSKHLDNHSVADFIRNADLDAPTVVVCYHGNSSQSAAAYLISQGFSDVYSMDGGFELWRTTYPAKPPKAAPNNFFTQPAVRARGQTNGLPQLITYLAFTSRITNYP